MAFVNVYQSKVQRLVMAPETSIGLAATINSGSYLIPAEEVTFTPAGRGTGIISRQGVNDGYAGSVLGAPGSFGGSLSFKTELFDISGTSIDNYWTLLLAACGHARLSQPSDLWYIQPSQNAMGNYSANTASPIALSFVVAQDVGAGSDDYGLYMHGSTGKVAIELVAGERAMMNFEFKSLVETPFITTGINALSLGTFPSGSATPYVVKEITATFTDNTTTDPLDVVALASLTLDSAAEVPDVPDPVKQQGFGISPVLFNAAPTVSFTLGATATNNDYFMQNFVAGRTIEISITLTGGGGRTVKLYIPKVQYTGVSFEDTDGYVSYSVEANCVRDLNSSDAPYRIEAQLA